MYGQRFAKLFCEKYPRAALTGQPKPAGCARFFVKFSFH